MSINLSVLHTVSHKYTGFGHNFLMLVDFQNSFTARKINEAIATVLKHTFPLHHKDIAYNCETHEVWRYNRPIGKG